MSLDQNPEQSKNQEDPTPETSMGSAGMEMTSEETDEKDSLTARSKKEGSVNGEEDPSGSFFRIDSGLLPFPEKLMALLDGDQVADAMWWLPDGDAFCLIPVVFAEKVLDKHFQGTKFESFTRKLNRWGFKRVAGQKVPTNTIAYYNKNFLRGKPKLLKNMNGGKTKFISAREKRVRAQVKRERDREQAVMISQQQQTNLYADPMGSSSSRGLADSNMLAQAKLSLGQQNHMRLQNLLVSRPLAMQQAQLQERRMAEQMLAAEQVMVNQQREELQMRMLRAGMGGMGGGFPGMSDLPRGDLGGMSSQLFAARSNALRQSKFSELQQQQQQFRRGSGDMPVGEGGTGGGDMTTEQMLMARQMAAEKNQTSMAHRMMQLNSSTSSSGYSGMTDEATAKLVRQRMEEEQLLKTKAYMAQQSLSQQSKGHGSPSAKPAEGGWDPQLFQLYLLEQQRKRELTLSQARSNARSA